MAWQDRLRGGLADKLSPSDFDAKELAKGALHETEHTDDFALAVEIAMDHLVEDPHYYSKTHTRKTRKRSSRKAKKKRDSHRRPLKSKLSVPYELDPAQKKEVRLLIRDLFRDVYKG